MIAANNSDLLSLIIADWHLRCRENRPGNPKSHLDAETVEYSRCSIDPASGCVKTIRATGPLTARGKSRFDAKPQRRINRLQAFSPGIWTSTNGPLMRVLFHKRFQISELLLLLTTVTRRNGMSLAVLQRSKGRVIMPQGA